MYSTTSDNQSVVTTNSQLNTETPVVNTNVPDNNTEDLTVTEETMRENIRFMQKVRECMEVAKDFILITNHGFYNRTMSVLNNEEFADGNLPIEVMNEITRELGKIIILFNIIKDDIRSRNNKPEIEEVNEIARYVADAYNAYHAESDD